MWLMRELIRLMEDLAIEIQPGYMSPAEVTVEYSRTIVAANRWINRQVEGFDVNK
jgi:hypothetical protein